MPENTKQFIGSAPYFLVTDLHKSVDYYCNCLGFDRPELWGNPPDFAMPSRDGYIFMLKQAKNPSEVSSNAQKNHYWDAYIWVNDADALFAEYQKNGAEIHYDICIQQDYDMKEFAIEDPDGYVIAFGQHHEA